VEGSGNEGGGEWPEVVAGGDYDGGESAPREGGTSSSEDCG